MTNLTALPATAMPPGALAAVPEIRDYAGAGGRPLRFQVIEAKPARHQLLYLHGIESHGGWFLPAAMRLRDHGCTTWLLDRRGSGLNHSEGPGDVASVATLLEDVQNLRARLGDPLLHVVGLSWGGKLATAVALDHPRHVASLLLVAPALRARVDLSLREKLAVALSLLVGGARRFEVPIPPELFTHEPGLLAFIRDDPLRVTSVTARFLFATHRLDRLIARRIASLQAPVLLLLAGEDRIVDNNGVMRVLSGLPAEQLQVRRYERAMHAIQLEQTGAVVDDIVAFLQAPSRLW